MLIIVVPTASTSVDGDGEGNTYGAGAELIFLGINAGIGYEVNSALDVGIAGTVTYGMLEAGLGGTNAQSHDYGYRLTFGADYHLTDATDIGLYYQTKLRHNWSDSVFLSSVPEGTPANATMDELNAAIAGNASYHDLEMEQPANLALGVSHKFSDNFRVMSDVIHKNWSGAEFWQRFYHDQVAFSIGAELDQGPFTWRVGYGYANDPTRDSVQPRSLAGRDSCLYWFTRSWRCVCRWMSAFDWGWRCPYLDLFASFRDACYIRATCDRRYDLGWFHRTVFDFGHPLSLSDSERQGL